MAPVVPRLVVDASTVAKWKLTSESHAAEARELLLDWEQGSIQVCVPDQLLVEIVSAFLGSARRHPPRLTVVQARAALRDLLALPFTVFRTRGTALLARAFDIAHQHNQRAYDCVCVALAERKRLEFWTGDDRLCNALHADFTFIRPIAAYARRRPLT